VSAALNCLVQASAWQAGLLCGQLQPGLVVLLTQCLPAVLPGCLLAALSAVPAALLLGQVRHAGLKLACSCLWPLHYILRACCARLPWLCHLRRTGCTLPYCSHMACGPSCYTSCLHVACLLDCLAFRPSLTRWPSVQSTPAWTAFAWSRA
jgi:hypothetical protein